MNNDQVIQQVEVSLEHAKKTLALSDALRRLESNRDFQQVILQGFFVDEAARLVGLTAEPNLPDKARDAVWHNIRAIGELRQYFIAKHNLGEMARKSIGDFEEHLDEIRTGVDNGEDE